MHVKTLQSTFLNEHVLDMEEILSIISRHYLEGRNVSVGQYWACMLKQIDYQ